jgi:SAM-dependent methyltransferase
VGRHVLADAIPRTTPPDLGDVEGKRTHYEVAPAGRHGEWAIQDRRCSVPSEFFAQVYEGEPPWDIGRPQGVVRCLLEAAQIRGRALDVGCGTGENALALAELGIEVVGVDAVPSAVARAQEKARRRGLAASFVVGDALHLGELGLGERFESVLDSGLFHTFTDEERPLYRASLATVMRPLGRLFILCFSEHERGSGGPRRVTRAELHATFDAGGFRVRRIDPALLETREGDGRQAWLASVQYVAGGARE